MGEFNHTSVLLNESIDGLNIKPDGIYLDGTLGGAGHSSKILSKLTTGTLIAIDKDINAINNAKEKFKDDKRIKIIHDDFKNAMNILDDLKISRLDGVLLDLGISSYQIDKAERGFSYMQDAKLDMRMDQSQFLTAFNVVNEYNEYDLANIIYKYGEESFAKIIAKNIIKARKQKAVATTKDLTEIIDKSIPAKYKKHSHPAKKTFQAIRIEVNSELNDLDKIITKLVLKLNEGGRMCVITFHSLEDRIVKHAFKYLALDCICEPTAPVCTCSKEQQVKIITRKPIIPSDEEMKNNPRSKSAKLRIIQRI